MNEVLEFIKRRFPKDCNWTTGNCYYFALILKNRFPEGDIYYDIKNGHFFYQNQDCSYDWTGIYKPVDNKCIVQWEEFDEYDSLQKERIVRDCIV